MSGTAGHTSPGDLLSRTAAMINMIIADRYRVIAPLGSGGMAHVFRAEQLSLKREVALKILRSEIAASPAQLKRFLQEAQAASQIHHPNVVEVIDFGQLPDGSAFLVMEFLRGEPLDELLRRRGRLTWSEIVTLMPQATRALGAAHRRGIIHRDVKPSNCVRLKSDDGSDLVKVIDFGIAKVLESDSGSLAPPITRSGAVFGTANYISPEQASGAKVDGRADIYSFGVMLFELVTGRVPFQGDSFIQIAHKQIYTPPPSIFDVAPGIDVPKAADVLIAKALAKAPDDRQQSMRELEADIVATAGWSSGRVGLEAAAVDTGTPQRRSGGGLRRAAFAMAVVALLAVVVGLAAWWGRRIDALTLVVAQVTNTEMRSPEAAAAEVAAETPTGANRPSLGGAEASEPAPIRIDEGAAAKEHLVGADAGHQRSTSEDAPPQSIVATAKPSRPSPPETRPTELTTTSVSGKLIEPKWPGSDDGEAPPSSVPPSPTPSHASRPTELGFLTDKQVTSGLAGVRDRLERCRRQHGASLGATVRVEITIVAGQVVQARPLAEGAGSDLGKCVAQQVKGARFPKARSRVVERELRL